jgi:type VI secretion system secreted protein Hcp
MSDTQDKPGFASFIGRPLLAGAMVASAALPAPAVADVFLKIDSIPGESADSKHKDEIDILSYTQSFRQIINRTTGGGGTGKVSCGDITVLKNIDKSSPKLIEAVTTSKHIPKATLTFRTVGGKSQIEYYIVDLQDVLIAAIDQTDQPDPSKIVERVQLNPASFEFTYRQQKSDGSVGGEVKFGYDCLKNEKL